MSASFHHVARRGHRARGRDADRAGAGGRWNAASLASEEKSWEFREWADWDLRYVRPSRSSVGGVCAGATAGLVPFPRGTTRRSGLPHLHPRVHERHDAVGVGEHHPSDTPIQSASIRSRAVVHASVPGRRLAALRPVVPSAGFGRALTQGRIFNREGHLVAAVRARASRDSCGVIPGRSVRIGGCGARQQWLIAFP